MKNFKFLLGLIPIFAVTFSVYFFTSGFTPGVEISNTTEVITDEAKKPSDICMFQITLLSNELNCMPGTYKVCVNGGTPQTLGDTFELGLECGGTYTICVNSTSGGCSGSITVSPTCPCQRNNPRTIMLSATSTPCAC